MYHNHPQPQPACGATEALLHWAWWQLLFSQTEQGRKLKTKQEEATQVKLRGNWHLTRAGFWVFGLGCLIMLPFLALPDLYPSVFEDELSLLASFPLRALLGLPAMLFMLGVERLLLRKGIVLLSPPEK
ncbi:hypothetical protein MJ923_00485 [Shewanella sp. 3B26]|uniref:Uncharacterized protein n=1 Tax=Shewanella zhuhaiensis TaxID=2919576 RepID=A0AAJ1F922_9GAMM|nr:hypothetical protein [Shewanella zhuhaiensis]MCH4292775.1 hypothetical protein [Shewanella zhuhaiensis]